MSLSNAMDSVALPHEEAGVKAPLIPNGRDLDGIAFRSRPRSKLSAGVTIVACFLTTCTLGFNYTFGNMNPYLTSYLRNVTHGEIDYTDTLWIPQINTVVCCTLMPFIGLLANTIPRKLYMLLGIIFNAGSLFGTFWAVQTSFLATMLTFGVLGGVPAAFLYPTCLKICAEYVPRRRGMIVGVILMGYGIGSFMLNALITWCINHDNLMPDLRTGQDLYYTQASLLDQVPRCFLLLGTVIISVQVLAVIAIRLPPSSSAPTVTVVNEREAASVEDCSERKPLLAGAEAEADSRHPGEDRPEYGWRQVVRSRVFWILWIMMFFGQFGFCFVISLFKAYGQTFISDDHFLATVAMASSICNAAGRPFWGLIADRVGPRIVALLAQVSFAALIVTFPSCHETGRAAYLLWVCAMFVAMCALFTMLPLLTLQLFGPQHFNVNMGLMDSNMALGAILPTVIVPWLKGTFGWNGLFFVGYGGLCIGVLLNMSLEFKLFTGAIPRHMQKVLSIKR